MGRSGDGKKTKAKATKAKGAKVVPAEAAERGKGGRRKVEPPEGWVPTPIKGPKDSYGALNREPPRPKRAILVQLRRALQSAENHVERVKNWRERVKTAEALVASTTSLADKAKHEKALAKLQATLAGKVARRGYILRRMAVLIDAAKTRTLANEKAVEAGGGKAAVMALIERCQNVIDVVTVRESLAGRDEAFKRLSETACRIGGKLIYRAVYTGLITDEDARAKAEVAVLTAIEQWRWAKSAKPALSVSTVEQWEANLSGARFTSYAFQKIGRELQFRTRADRPIMSTQREDGSWSQAGSLDLLIGGDGTVPGSREFTPSAVHHHQTPASAGCQGREETRRVQVAVDVTEAMATLSPIEQDIAQALLVSGEKIKVVAERLKMSETALKAKRTAIMDKLRDVLSAYQPNEDNDL